MAFNSEAVLWEIRRRAEIISQGLPEWRYANGGGRERIALELAKLVFELDRDLTHGVAELPRDWRPK